MWMPSASLFWKVQFCRPLLCTHRKLALKSPHHAFWKERREGGELSFIWHLLCAPHRFWLVCQALLLTPPACSVSSAYFTEKETNSQILGDLLKVNLNK